jgi:uncharacterized protein
MPNELWMRHGDAAMTQAAKAQEPSMEEILASIRRIIADDDNKPDAKPAAAAPAPAPVPPPPAPTPRIDPPKAAKPEGIDVLMEDSPKKELPPIASSQADVLDLTESMVAPPREAPAPAASFQTIDGEPDVIFTEDEAAPPPAASRVFDDPLPPRSPPQSSFERSLLSGATASAVDSAFNSLAHTVLVQNARTLEDLVREMLRPMLKNWLDDNLPNIVERLVKSEIDRVSRGRG